MLLAQRAGFVCPAHALQMNGQRREVGEGFFVVAALLAAAEIEVAAQRRLVSCVARHARCAPDSSRRPAWIIGCVDQSSRQI